MKTPIDLRSDTVTRPGKAMLNAMMNARVGDDVFGDDPTVKELEEYVAGIVGHEAALFAPSGTMANQIAINVHVQPGDEVICDEGAHVYRYEGGGIAVNSGASVRLLKGDRGRISVKDISGAVNPDDPHYPHTRLVALENSSNRGGGSCYSLEAMKQISAFCRKNGLLLHLDGARLFNALVYTGQKSDEVGPLFDSVSVCLSKGLGAPVGSVVAGNRDFIREALRVRKRFGGGMRQAGYLAAAGLFALKNNISRLAEDHERAAVLAKALSETAWVKEIMPVETNIIICRLANGLSPDEVLEKLKRNNILAVPFGPDQIRFVTHLDFNDQMLNYTCNAIKNLD
ncbi:MAG: GntG family PLP-dependent aldolase [Bacteroidales bacterium]